MYQKYSMYRNDETVFSPYVLKKLCAEAKANADAGMLTLFGAMSEDAVPVAFTADVHLMRRAKERLGTSYAEIVMADVIRAAEHSETLGQAILDAIDDAGDNGKSSIYWRFGLRNRTFLPIFSAMSRECISLLY